MSDRSALLHLEIAEGPHRRIPVFDGRESIPAPALTVLRLIETRTIVPDITVRGLMSVREGFIAKNALSGSGIRYKLAYPRPDDEVQNRMLAAVLPKNWVRSATQQLCHVPGIVAVFDAAERQVGRLIEAVEAPLHAVGRASVSDMVGAVYRNDPVRQRLLALAAEADRRREGITLN